MVTHFSVAAVKLALKKRCLWRWELSSIGFPTPRSGLLITGLWGTHISAAGIVQEVEKCGQPDLPSPPSHSE